MQTLRLRPKLFFMSIAPAAMFALSLAGIGQDAPKEAAGNLPGQAATLLGTRCLSCHNPTKKAGGLDFSTRQTALTTGVLVPRAPDKSKMLQIVMQGKMPPEGKLPAAEITLLRKWIADGAAYSREPLEAIKPASKPLWSFQPVKHASIPKTPFDALSDNPVDRFLFAELSRKGLHPSPPADKRTLLRRVTIDLTGLPPTPEEIAAFLADKTPKAYGKVVDRLLASPAYGERWGRHWLDVVRYGESHGYEQNHLRPNAWPYRDYVIRSFNEDKPYPQFITEQLAGDIVGQGNTDIEAATGFLVAGIHDTVGNSTVEGTRQQRANDLDDMVATTGATFLGLTINCAHCHDHKFDPIPQKDYYRLSAVFAGVRHGERPLPSRPLNPTKQQELNQAQKSLQTVTALIAALDEKAKANLTGSAGKRPAVSVKHNAEEFAPLSARFVRFTVLATNDGAEPCVDELQIFGPDEETNLALASQGAKATASSLLPGFDIHQIANLNDGKFGNSHSWISNERGAGWAQIELPKSATLNRIAWGRDAEEQFQDRLPISYRVEVSTDGSTWKQVADGKDRTMSSGRFTANQLITALPPEQRAKRIALAAQQTTLQQRITALAPTKLAYIGQFTPPDPTYLLKRGDVMQQGEIVMPGALSRINSLSPELMQTTVVEDSSHPRLTIQKAPIENRKSKIENPLDPRLALARWICDPRNPLTARVMVNRVWEHHFGRGLVSTPSDFGNVGEPPSHPKLLDWLASVFTEETGLHHPPSARDAEARRGEGREADAPQTIENRKSKIENPYACGWKLKKLHRLMVTSYIYRQTNAVQPESAAKDGDNRLLWHIPLRRMEAEAVRDAVLQTSGKLNRQMGGPSFLLFKYRVINVAIYEPLEEFGPATWRRSVYQMPARGIRDEILATFDCPDSSERAPRRTSTTTALQALSLLNGNFISQQSDAFAQRVQQEAGKERPAQITKAFQLAFGRTPTPKEQQSAASLVAQHGLPTLCRALLNSNEFLYY